MRLLNGLGERPDRVEVDELAVKLGFVLGPDLFHGERSLPEHTPTPLVIGSVILHLFGVPSAADAKDSSPVRKPVQRSDFLGGNDRVTLDHKADTRGQTESCCGSRGGGKSDKRVVSVPVLTRQVAAAGIRSSAASGNVSVFRKPDRLESALLYLTRQL